ncbi:MAG TPA: carbon-nitrogen hydrolase family protein [Polyangiaceae bacterium]|jgi:predicted amidohydrolase
MPAPFRIALANLPFPVTPEDSVARAALAVADAGAAGAGLVVFPECYVPGYRTPHTQLPPPDAAFLDRAWSALGAACAKAKVAAVVGTERVEGSKVFITALVLDARGARCGFQDKVQMAPPEDSFFAAGTGRHVFRVGPLTFGVVLCHEGWRYPETVRWAARRGAQLVVHPHYEWAEPGAFRPSSFADPRNTFHEKAMLCRAAENGCWFASVNYAAEGSPTTSAVVTPEGELLAYQPYGQAGLLVADIDLDAAKGFLASRCKTDPYA